MSITQGRNGIWQGLSTDTRPALADGRSVRPGDRFYIADQGRTLFCDPNRQVKSVRVVEGGADYMVGDALTFAPTGATGTVATVDGDGAILTLTVATNGAYDSPPAVTAAETTGSGAVLAAVLSDGWRYMDPAPAGASVGAIVDS